MDVQPLGSPAQTMDLGCWYRALREAKARLQSAAVLDSLVLPTEYADLFCVRQDDAVHVVVLDEFGDQAHVHEENDGWTVSEHGTGIVLPLCGEINEREVSSGLAQMLAGRLKGRWFSPMGHAMALAA